MPQAQKLKIDLDGALAAGYTHEEIAAHLKSIGASDEQINSIIPSKATQDPEVEAAIRQNMSTSLNQAAAPLNKRANSFGQSLRQDVTLPGTRQGNTLPEDELANAGNLAHHGAVAATGILTDIATGTPGASFIPGKIKPSAGSVTMSAMDQILRYLKGDKTGQDTENPILAAGEETLKNEGARIVLGGIASKAAGAGAGIINKFKPGTFKIPGISDELANLNPTVGQATGSKTLSTFEDMLAPGRKNAAAARNTLTAGNTVREEAMNNRLFQQVNGQAVPIPAASGLLSNLTKMKAFLKNGQFKTGKTVITSLNPRRDLQAVVIDDIWSRNFTPTDALNPTVGKFNADKAISDWVDFGKTKQFTELFGSQSGQTSRNWGEFWNAVRDTSKGVARPSGYMQMDLTRRGLFLTGAALSGRAGGVIGGTAYIGGYLTLAGIARGMSNKKAAPLIIATLKGQPLGMSVKAATRIIMQSFSGSPITLVDEKGQEHEGTVDTDGNPKVK